MPIQWFPGHMHKARKEIAQIMTQIDLVVEVLDARLPWSSSNPMVRELRGDTPVVCLLNKADLADPQRTREWVDYLSAEARVLPFQADQKGNVRKLINLCLELGREHVPGRLKNDRPVRVMVMGIPNVGKSTLINSLLGKRIAKVGNEPAVTKGQTRFVTKYGIAVYDTPGVLWPKIHDHDSTYRLAASGAIKDTVMEYEDVALYVLDFLLAHYREPLMQRYRFKTMPEDAMQALTEIGRRRGGLRSGGQVDLHKAAEVVVGDLRSGKIGQLTLETVSEWQQKALDQAEFTKDSASG